MNNNNIIIIVAVVMHTAYQYCNVIMHINPVIPIVIKVPKLLLYLYFSTDYTLQIICCYHYSR